MVLTVSLVLYAAQPAIGFGDMVAGADLRRSGFAVGISTRNLDNHSNVRISLRIHHIPKPTALWATLSQWRRHALGLLIMLTGWRLAADIQITSKVLRSCHIVRSSM